MVKESRSMDESTPTSTAPTPLLQALHNRALSGTKLLVEQYDQKVVDCINFLVDCEELSREEKMLFVKKARKALGQTALLLSGGGSISMYHAGKSEGYEGGKIY